MSKNQKGIIHVFVLIILALIVVGGIGYWVFKNGQIKPVPQITAPSPTPTQDSTANQTPNGDLANWKTFRNEKH